MVCNLYPFTETIAKPGCTLANAVEEIDIGGVTLLRAAAKNHERVSVLSDPSDYDGFLKAWKDSQGEVDQPLRSKLALKAFEMTAKYDDAISGYFREKYASSDLKPEDLAGAVQRAPLRYGANPHQKPAQAYVTSGQLPFKGASIEIIPFMSGPYLFLFSSLWIPRLHQPLGRSQLVCIGQGTV